MGQKVNPTGFRLGVVKNHNSVWYADKKQYSKYLLNDLNVREYLREKLNQASVSRIEYDRRSVGCGTRSTCPRFSKRLT